MLSTIGNNSKSSLYFSLPFQKVVGLLCASPRAQQHLADRELSTKMGRDARRCLVTSWHIGITPCCVLGSHRVLLSWYQSSSCRCLRDTVIVSFCFNFSLLLANEQTETRGGGTWPVGKLGRSVGSTPDGPGDLVQITDSSRTTCVLLRGP